MSDSELNQYEGTAKQLIEDINQLNKIALGEGAVACQVCGSTLSGGSPVSVFVYRPAGRPTFEVGHVICGDNEHDLPTYFTLGVRELIVEGHVGRCVDPTTHSAWPILLEPSVRVVSTMASKSGRIAPDSSTDSSGEVSWVYGDALLKRASDLEPDDAAPADDTPPTDHDETVIGDDNTDNKNPPYALTNRDETVDADETDSHADNATPADDSPPIDRDDRVDTDDTVSADANALPTAGTGPAGSSDAVPADADAVDDADGSPTNADTDETNADVDGGEC